MSRVGQYETGICQRLIAICWCVLMFSDVAGVSNAGVPLVEKWAYIGQAAELVSNIDSHYEDPTLYSENGTYITSWKGNTSEPSDCHYVGKFHMDDKRNIWILRVEREDAGKYSVKFGAKKKRHEVHIILTVKELTDEQSQKCPNNHPDFTKEGNLSGEQIRKLLDDHTEHIKEYLDRRNPLFLDIVTFIIGMIILLCLLLANGNQIREGLINMKDWIQKKLCCQPMSGNGSQSQVASFGMEESVEPDLQLPAQHGTCPISTMTVTDETNSKVQRPFKNIERLLPRNNDTVFTDTQSSTSNVEQNTNIKSKKRPEDLDSDSDSNDEQDKLLKDSVDPDM